MTRRALQLAASSFLLATMALSMPCPRRCRRPVRPRRKLRRLRIKKDKKPPKENVEWLWQYGPPPADGRETQLVLDPRFRPFLAQYLTAPQTFWGNPKTGYKSLAETALDFLSVPDKVIADDNRYLTITGCVFRFCPARGLLWVDLNGPHPLVVFTAIDWIKDSKTPDQPGRRIHALGLSQPPHRPRTHSRSAGPQHRTLDRTSTSGQQSHSADPQRHPRRSRRHAAPDSAGQPRRKHIHPPTKPSRRHSHDRTTHSL